MSLAARRVGRLFLIFGAVTAILVTTGTFLFPIFDRIDCALYDYNDRLNGGEKQFAGQKYTIQLCGSGSNDDRWFGDGMDLVELSVIDESGETLVKRRYKVFWGGRPGNEPLTIGPTSITYMDAADQQDRTITMPPAAIERVRVLIPFLR